MPTRSIRPSHRSITGTVQSALGDGPLHFESSLERDFLILLDFQGGFTIETQPVRIQYEHLGREASYTPDVLVQYDNASVRPCGPWDKILFEVKYHEELRASWSDFRPKFEAARAWATAHNGTFRIVTDRHIRTPRLANIRLIKQQENRARVDHLIYRIQDHSRRGPIPLGVLLAYTEYPIAEARWHVYSMLRTRELHANLDVPLTDETLVWSWNCDYADALAEETAKALSQSRR